MRAAAFLLVLLTVASCGSASPDTARRFLSRLALSDVVLEDAFPADCFLSRHMQGRRFTATNARGETVRGVVCWSIGKATALQLDGQ